jgi:hypothetical protein
MQGKLMALVQYNASLATIAVQSCDYSQVNMISSEHPKNLAERNDASDKGDRLENPMVKQFLNSKSSSQGISAGMQEMEIKPSPPRLIFLLPRASILVDLSLPQLLGLRTSHPKIVCVQCSMSIAAETIVIVTLYPPVHPSVRQIK